MKWRRRDSTAEIEEKKKKKEKKKKGEEAEPVEAIENVKSASTVEMLREKANELEASRFYRKREQRLANWHKIPVNPDLSYGARIADISENADTDKAQKLSMEQFAKEY